MPDEFMITDLQEKDVNRAYAVLSSAISGLSIEAWEEYCRRAQANGGGIAAAYDHHGYIYGLACYQILPSLLHGKLLWVDYWQALHPLKRAKIMAALEQKLKELAKDHQCQQISSGLGTEISPARV